MVNISGNAIIAASAKNKKHVKSDSCAHKLQRTRFWRNTLAHRIRYRSKKQRYAVI